MIRAPIVVVGAGLAGLCVARSLRDIGANPIVFDKGRHPGGRLAVTKLSDRFVEIGPCWFVTRKDRISPAVAEALDDLGAVAAEPSLIPGSVRRFLPRDDSAECRVIPGGIRRLAEKLAEPLDVRCSHHIRSIERWDDRWLLSGTDAAHRHRSFVSDAEAVVLTAPWPQARELCRTAGVVDFDAVFPDGSEPVYERAWVAVYSVGGDAAGRYSENWTELESSEAIQSIRWLPPLDRDGTAIVVVVADHEWSQKHWEDDESKIFDSLARCLRDGMGEALDLQPIVRHRWGYARSTHPQSGRPNPWVATEKPLLVVAGEAFGVTEETPAGLLSAQESAAKALLLLQNHLLRNCAK